MHWQDIYNLGGANLPLFRAINGIHGPFWDPFMYVGTRMGYYFAGFGAYMAVAMLAFLWRMQLLGGKKAALPTAVELSRLLLLLTVIVCSHVVAIELGDAIKDAMHMPRPYILLPADQVVRTDSLLVAKNDYQSFPSNHAVFMAVMLVGFWPLLGRKMRAAGMVLAIWVMASRVSLGVHFPSDLLGGFLLGAGVTLIIRTLLLQLAPPALRLPQLMR